MFEVNESLVNEAVNENFTTEITPKVKKNKTKSGRVDKRHKNP